MSRSTDKPPRLWTTPKHKTSTRNAEHLSEIEKLGSHTGTLSAKKSLAQADQLHHPKLHQKWVIMHPSTRGGLVKANGKDLTEINNTIFASLIGFSISDICPLWRLTRLTLKEKPQYAARTKFIRNFKTLEDACRGKENYDLIIRSSQKSGDLARRKIPRFCALAKVLGNYDLPERNWGYSEKSGQVFMSDLDQSAAYLRLDPEHQNSPLRFQTTSEMKDYRKACCIDTPYIKTIELRGNDLIILRDDLDSNYEEAVGRASEEDTAVSQHFQTLFASTLLPEAWIENIALRYLAPQPDLEPIETPQARFNQHIQALQESLSRNPKFQEAFKANRDEWIIEALANFEKFNLHECQNGKRPEVKIDLRAIIKLINETYGAALPSEGTVESKGTPSEISDKDEELIKAAEKRGQHYFLLIKAKEYLTALEGKAKFSLRSFPSTARNILEKLERTQVTQENWDTILQQLNNALEKKPLFGHRDEMTTHIYTKLRDLIQETYFKKPGATTSDHAAAGTGTVGRAGSTYELTKVGRHPPQIAAVLSGHLLDTQAGAGVGSLNGDAGDETHRP